MELSAKTEARPGDGAQVPAGVADAEAEVVLSDVLPLGEETKVPEEPEAAEPAPRPVLVRVRHEGDILVVALDSGAPYAALRDEFRRLFKHRLIEPAATSDATSDEEEAAPTTTIEAAPAEDAQAVAPDSEGAPDETDEVAIEAEPAGDVEPDTASPGEPDADGAADEPSAALDEDEPAEDEPAEDEIIDDSVGGIPGPLMRPYLAVRLDMGGRPVDPFDLRLLVHQLKDDYKVAVTGVYCSPAAVHRYAQQELKVPVLLRAPLEDVDHEPEDCEGPTAIEPEPILRPKKEQDERKLREASDGSRKLLVVDKTMRGGAIVRYAGDVIVFGDVNAGAQVEAGGNIYVLGSLRGLAHAGVPGTDEAVILAFDLRPTQLRIARRIGYPPPREEKPANGGGIGTLFGFNRTQPEPQRTEIAYVRDGEITLEEFRGQLPVFAESGA